jgi:hypothetical protein
MVNLNTVFVPRDIRIKRKPELMPLKMVDTNIKGGINENAPPWYNKS